ncbi:hypothetical protein FGSG_04761 [Fusarium graminearum PH-1]|uniref:hypothetical protein n=1 Tax=Gibberella zeae (strain ATCC MYA-4620 / CBS 123657 / FGSC 9075 / NRRL 31084 / PH-1) TaxID=229533 RepID=UPI000023ECD7|nr:hypothetical protein FGSG_04761 [Fusarium graminearum PH-1]ESU10628.1 hypothetical protein FGSG_04761 [Fusarium graminearum PH-1]|eukprot:XP_011323204.1 hypothetical protein FGSG_04761 [Fusarium graminearum PH-1]
MGNSRECTGLFSTFQTILASWPLSVIFLPWRTNYEILEHAINTFNQDGETNEWIQRFCESKSNELSNISVLYSVYLGSFSSCPGYRTGCMVLRSYLRPYGCISRGTTKYRFDPC